RSSDLDGDDLHQLRSPVHDHVLIHAEEQHIAAGEVGTLMAFAGNIGQALEGVHQLALNPVGDCQPRFSEQVAPNLSKIIFGFRRDDVGFHEPERSLSLSHAALSAAKRARSLSPAMPSPRSSWARPRSILALIASLFSCSQTSRSLCISSASKSTSSTLSNAPLRSRC